MSRIGKKPIIIPADINITIDNGIARVSGPKGQLDVIIPEYIKIVKTDNLLNVIASNSKVSNLLGLTRSLIQNAVTGVKDGWSKTLEMVGVGFRAQSEGNKLVLNVGFSHPVNINAANGISFQVKENKITVLGIDKYLVGETAALIRRAKPPEPYKGKGIRYEGEFIRKKLGKAAKTVGVGGSGGK